ncbi:MAG: hypothetical protein V3R86_07170 [Candidatus Hydrothermarchaeaceae archaeon]
MDKIKAELEKLKDKVYIKEMNRNLEFAKEFLAKAAEDPNLLDSVPEGALLVPYPILIHKKEEEKAKA